MGDSWVLNNDTDIFLDPSEEWHDEELNGKIYDSRIFQQAERGVPLKGKRRRRSKVSVSVC